MDGIKGLILTPLLFAIVLAYLLCPVVDYLERQRISRWAAIAIIYLFFAVLLVIFCLNVFPVLIEELQQLLLTLPEYTEKFMLFITHLENSFRRFNLPEGIQNTLKENIQQLQSSLTLNLEKLSQFMLAFFRQAFALLLVPLFAFYILRDNALLKKRFLQLIPPSSRLLAEKTLHEINITLGAYLRGIFIISLSVGIMIYLGLLILGVQFALFFGILNALTNVIPYFGPLIGAVPVLLTAFFQSSALFWKVLLLIVIVQQVESQFITPQILGRSLHFHPLLVIIALLVGGMYMGFFGLIVIIPLMAILRIILRHFYPVIIQSLRKETGKKDQS